MTEAEKAYQYFVIAVPENEEQAKAYFWARKALRPTLTPSNEWVSVENALPPEHEPVLCIVSGKPKANITLEEAYQLGSWNKADGWIIDEWLDWEGANVTWWMPLPASPDKDNNVPAKTPNEPLTLEQLREMDEPTPVWWKKAGFWCLCERGFIIAPNGNIYEFEETDGAFYLRPPEGEEE